MSVTLKFGHDGDKPVLVGTETEHPKLTEAGRHAFEQGGWPEPEQQGEGVDPGDRITLHVGTATLEGVIDTCTPETFTLEGIRTRFAWDEFEAAEVTHAPRPSLPPIVPWENLPTVPLTVIRAQLWHDGNANVLTTPLVRFGPHWMNPSGDRVNESDWHVAGFQVVSQPISLTVSELGSFLALEALTNPARAVGVEKIRDLVRERGGDVDLGDTN